MKKAWGWAFYIWWLPNTAMSFAMLLGNSSPFWQTLFIHHKTDKINSVKKCKCSIWMLKPSLSPCLYASSSKSSAPSGVMLESCDAQISPQKFLCAGFDRQPWSCLLSATPLALASAVGQAQALGRDELFGAAEQSGSTLRSTGSCQEAGEKSSTFGCSQVSLNALPGGPGTAHGWEATIRLQMTCPA